MEKETLEKINSKEAPSFYDIQIGIDGTIKYVDDQGDLHRLDGPAVEYTDGSKEWFVNGRRHRSNGPAIESADGKVQWFMEGFIHRKDGPAVEFPDGSKEYWMFGGLHRLDGPAIEYASGYKEWWVNDELVGKSSEGFTDKDFEKWKKKHGL